MRKLIIMTVALLAFAFTISCGGDPEEYLRKKIIAMERSALDRWGNGDPQGYLEIYALDVTYFDPFRERRIDGLGAMKELLIPGTGKIKIDRYDMISPKVQSHGDMAVLTYNLVDYSKQSDGAEKVTVRWNATEVFRRIDGDWKIIHSHWSFIKPELK